MKRRQDNINYYEILDDTVHTKLQIISNLYEESWIIETSFKRLKQLGIKIKTKFVKLILTPPSQNLKLLSNWKPNPYLN
jgi:hypothetical protein